MVLSVLAIILNAVFIAVLNMSLYTDQAHMPSGEVRVWHRSPRDRLYIADRASILYLQYLLAAVSVVTSLLILFGVRNETVRMVWLAGTAASIVIFVIIMVMTSNIHARYA